MIDANGILNVIARDMRTGKQQSIEVKPTYGLTDEEVEKMLIDSMESAESDFAARMLIDAEMMPTSCCDRTDKAMKRADEFLTIEEKQAILKAEQDLREAYNGADAAIVREKMEQLDKATLKLAEGIMNKTIADALRDKTLDQLEDEAERTTHK